MRNLLSLGISTFFCYRTVKDPALARSPEFPSQLYDFEQAILGSVLPYLYFKRFVMDDKDRRNAYAPHLKIVTSYQQYIAYSRQIRIKLYANEEEQRYIESQMQA